MTFGGWGAGRTVAARGTGAYLPGAAGGGSGLGKFAAGHRGLRVTSKGLAIVEKHLMQFGDVPENAAMVARLRAAMQSGRLIRGADAIFYTHEVAEATMVARGVAQELAHSAAFAKYGVSPLSVYHPSVINAFPAHFNNAWRAFWGLAPL